MTFGRLKFVTRQERKVGDNGVEKYVTRCNYDLEQICSDETSGYFLIQYTPVCIKVHLKMQSIAYYRFLAGHPSRSRYDFLSHCEWFKFTMSNK